MFESLPRVTFFAASAPLPTKRSAAANDARETTRAVTRASVPERDATVRVRSAGHDEPEISRRLRARRTDVNEVGGRAGHLAGNPHD